MIDPRGQQVADLLAFNAADLDEVISSSRTLDYAEKIYLDLADKLYSNRSHVMLTIVADTVGRHDFLLTPCSVDTFTHFYPELPVHRGCFGNLAAALDPFGIAPGRIPVAFNCFMNVPIDGETGKLEVLPPISRAGDHITFRAEMDLVTRAQHRPRTVVRSSRSITGSNIPHDPRSAGTLPAFTRCRSCRTGALDDQEKGQRQRRSTTRKRHRRQRR